MKLKVSYDNFTEETYDSMEEAKDAILEAFANQVNPDCIEELDENGEELDDPRYFGCSWSVEIEELP